MGKIRNSSYPADRTNNLLTMKRIILLLLAVTSVVGLRAQKNNAILSTEKFSDAVNHWLMTHDKTSYECYSEEEYLAIADNMVAYQNEDGGWPKNLDMTAKLDPDSVKSALEPRHRQSTLDNRNIYSQVEYLSMVYSACGKKIYKKSAQRGIEYILEHQYPNGGWRGWDADAITFNDGCMTGVLFLWHDILRGEPQYDWVDKRTREAVEASWNAAIELILKTQYVQNGVKTVWCQQHDHQTLLPTKARSYELPSLSGSESADVVMLLMSIENPSEPIKEAIEAAAAWYEKTKITGKRMEFVSLPNGHPEDPKIKRDRILVDDPEAKPLWARYYELDDNRVFFCNRDGVKVYSLEEVAPERRVGYGWYGTWGNKVLKQYKKWKKKMQKSSSEK